MRRRAVLALVALASAPAAWAQASALPSALAAPTAPASAGGEPHVAEMVEALRPRAVRPDAAASAPAASTAPTPAPSPPPSPASSPSLWLPVQFQPDSAQVRPGSGPLLGALVAAMQTPELKDSRFLVEGHAERGNAAARARLALERADQVRLYLVALGVHPSRLRAVASAAAAPAVRGEGARRVRIVTQE